MAATACSVAVWLWRSRRPRHALRGGHRALQFMSFKRSVAVAALAALDSSKRMQVL